MGLGLGFLCGEMLKPRADSSWSDHEGVIDGGWTGFR